MSSMKRNWWARKSSSTSPTQRSGGSSSGNGERKVQQQATLSKFFCSKNVASSSTSSDAEANGGAAAQTVSVSPAASTLSRLQLFQQSAVLTAPSPVATDNDHGCRERSDQTLESGRASPTRDITLDVASNSVTVVDSDSEGDDGDGDAVGSSTSRRPQPVAPPAKRPCLAAMTGANKASSRTGQAAARPPSSSSRTPSMSPSPRALPSTLPRPLSASPATSVSSALSARKLLPYTPLERQYVAIRDANPGVLLMVECGYKFRFFGDDAEVAARILNIFCHPMHNFMNASIPVPRLSVHVRRLVMAGYKVGVVRQAETAAHKAASDNRSAPFERVLSDVYTRATLIGEAFDSPLPSQSYSGRPSSRQQSAAAATTTPRGRRSAPRDFPCGDDDDDAAEDVAGAGEGDFPCADDTAAWSSAGDSHMLFVVDADAGDLPAAELTGGEAGRLGDGGHQLAVVAVQPATGDLVYSLVVDDASRSQLLTHLAHVLPCEVIVPADLRPATRDAVNSYCKIRQSQGDLVRLEEVPAGWHDYGASYGCLLDFYQIGATSVHELSDDEEDSSEDGDGRDDRDPSRDRSRDQSRDWSCDASDDRLPSSQSSQKEHWAMVRSLPKPVIVCLGVALRHLKQFNLAAVLRDTRNFTPFSNAQQCMVLNEQSLRSLEVFGNGVDGSERGSLLGTMINTSTAFGRRLFRQWLAKPLVQRSAISARHDAVGELSSHFKSPCLKQCRALLSHLPDIERGLGSIMHKKCSTGDFHGTLQALMLAASEVGAAQDEALALFQSSLLREAFNEIPELLSGVQAFFDSMDARAAKSGDKTSLFTDLSKFPQVAATKEALKKVDTDLMAHRREVRLKLGAPALEYKTVSGDDYLIEVSHKQQHKVPQTWDKINSTKQAGRYRSPFIVEQLKSRALLLETLAEQSQAAWIKHLSDFSSVLIGRCRRCVHHLASLDCLISLARLAAQPGYVRPTMLSDDAACELAFVGGWHPVVAGLLSNVNSGSQFVPNSTSMKVDDNRVSIITGPNMGGKSCFVRQVALMVIMAQMGSFVPAESARMSVLDGVYVRMGASDDMEHGRSTFMVELQETSEVLRRASPRSLVILDELGRGTSTHDGVAIAYATLDHLISSVRCLVLFVTHYPLLAQLCDAYPGAVRAFHMAFLNAESDESDESADTTEQDGQYRITFLYQLVAGLADKSYGLNVARLAGLPRPILHRAAMKSEWLEGHVTEKRSSTDAFRSCWTQYET